MSEKPTIEVLPIELGATTDPNNVNRHTARGGALVGNSLQRRGAFRSIASAGKGVDIPTVYAGNLTLEKAVEAGFKEIVNVHVRGDQLVNVVRDDIEPGSAEAIALGLEDNESAAKSYNPDIDILAALAAGDNAILTALRKEDKVFNSMLDGMGLKDETQDAEPQIDRAAELLEKWGVKTGDLWRIGEHRLLCGDSTYSETAEKLLNGEKATMVFTDPPYALMGNSTGVNGITDDKMTAPFFREVFKRARDFTIPFAHVYVCCDWHSAFALRQAGIDVGLIDKNLIVWDKGDGGIGAMYQMCHELVWLFTNTPKGGVLVGKRGERTVNGVSNIWRIPRMEAERDIYSQKPLELVQIPVKHGCDDNDIVMDLFAGSGTTLVACQNLGRKCRAIEISEKYCAVILERMATAFPGIEIVKP